MYIWSVNDKSQSKDFYVLKFQAKYDLISGCILCRPFLTFPKKKSNRFKCDY